MASNEAAQTGGVDNERNPDSAPANAKAHHSSSRATSTNFKGDDSLVLEGLVLQNILSFALQNARDFSTFCRVNKAWNGATRNSIIVDLCQSKVERYYKSGLSKNATKFLLERAFVELRYKDSGLYQQRKISSKCLNPVPKWPVIQIRYHVALRTIVHYLVMKGPVYEMKNTFVYNMVCDHIKMVARGKVQAISTTLIQYSEAARKHRVSLSNPAAIRVFQSTLCTTLKELLEHWNAWEGITKRCVSITSSLKGFVKARELTPPETRARSDFVYALLGAVLYIDSPTTMAARDLMGDIVSVRYYNERKRQLGISSASDAKAIAERQQLPSTATESSDYFERLVFQCLKVCETMGTTLERQNQVPSFPGVAAIQNKFHDTTHLFRYILDKYE